MGFVETFWKKSDSDKDLGACCEGTHLYTYIATRLGVPKNLHLSQHFYHLSFCQIEMRI